MYLGCLNGVASRVPAARAVASAPIPICLAPGFRRARGEAFVCRVATKTCILQTALALALAASVSPADAFSYGLPKYSADAGGGSE